jgi:hypothetical protein
MPLAHGPSHQFRDDGALVLIGEGLVKFRFHFIRYTEIVEIFNNATIHRSHATSMATARRFVEFSRVHGQRVARLQRHDVTAAAN